MSHDPKRPTDRLDEFLEAGDPVKRSSLNTDEIESALDEIGTSITSRSRPAPRAAWRRPFRRPRAAILIGAAVIAGGATVAGSAELGARTGHHQPTKQEIAKAKPKAAARMKFLVAMGGPGEFLNPSASNFRDVALRISSDIPYPKAFEQWREAVVAESSTSETDVRETSGALRGFVAMSAFCAWVLDWRHAMIVGDTQAVERDALVISGAPDWKAIKAEDPHPDPTVTGDMGYTQSTLFGWILPLRSAVLAGDKGQVEHLLSTQQQNHSRCIDYDEDFTEYMATHVTPSSTLSIDEFYARYLASRHS